jgi:hypothetical protein
MNSDIFQEGGWVIISRDVDSGVDVCSHKWSPNPVREIHGYRVYICKRNGCFGIYSPSRSAIKKFIECYRKLPKIPFKLPQAGYYSDEEIQRRFGIDPRQAREYYEVLQGLDIDGAPAHIVADGRTFMYRDDKAKPLMNEGEERRLPQQSTIKTRHPFLDWLAERPTFILTKPLTKRIREIRSSRGE